MLPFFRKASHGRRGAMSLEMLGILAIMGMVLSFAVSQSNESRNTARATALAHQLNTLTKGAQNYLDANATTLLEELNKPNVRHLLVEENAIKSNSSSTLSKPANSDSSMYNGLRPYLPMTFNQTSFNQDVKLYVYKGKDGTVHAMFGTSGGIPRSGTDSQKKDYANIARQVSGMSGFGLVMSQKAGGGALTTGKSIVGPRDSWRFRFGQNDYGNVDANQFDDFQLGRPLYSYSAAVKDDMLYRVKIEGHPELNAMQTNLYLDGNRLDNAGSVVIRQQGKITGSGDPGEAWVTETPGGEGLYIQPYTVVNGNKSSETDINAAAQQVCDAKASEVNDDGQASPDGFIFTLSDQIANGQRSQSAEDMSGIWMCLNGKARMISDSVNSSSAKGARILSNGDKIKKPACPSGTVPSIYLASATFAERQDHPSPLVAVQHYATSVDGDRNWQIHIRIKTSRHKGGVSSGSTSDTWTIPDKNDKLNYVYAQTMCERDLDVVNK